MKPFSLIVFIFSLACERIFIKTHSIKRRCAIGPENLLFAGASVHLSARKFYRLGSEVVKGQVQHVSESVWPSDKALGWQQRASLTNRVQNLLASPMPTLGLG